MEKNKKIKFGFPTRCFREQTIKLFELVGYVVVFEEKVYRLKIDDPEIECVLLKTEEIAEGVEKGTIDAGITPKVRLLDQKINAIKVAELNYGNRTWWNAKIVIAVPVNSKIKSIKDLQNKKILSRIPNFTKEYLEKKGIKAMVEFVDWPTESKVPTSGDAIMEFTNTGNALRAHNLKIIDVIMETPQVLIANKKSWENKWKRKKIENLAMLLAGAKLAQEYAGLMLHASNDMMARVLKVLPALKKPTVTHLRGENWFDVLTVAKKKEIRELIPKLKKIGCTDIVEFPLNKVVI